MLDLTVVDNMFLEFSGSTSMTVSMLNKAHTVQDSACTVLTNVI